MRADDLTGQRFGRLVALQRVENKGRVTQWLWRCDCGREAVVAADKAKSGHTVSCGCAWTEKCRKHGHGHDTNGRQTRTYKAWVNMRSRAQGVTDAYERNYASRGIVVCERWDRSFEAFLADMGECPPGMTLDRFPNNDGNYEPGNCRWATREQQMANTRRTRRVILDGQPTSLKDACRRVGVLYDTAIKRVWRGQTPQQAIKGISP
jgi:hypothetical protein